LVFKSRQKIVIAIYLIKDSYEQKINRKS